MIQNEFYIAGMPYEFIYQGDLITGVVVETDRFNIYLDDGTELSRKLIECFWEA